MKKTVSVVLLLTLLFSACIPSFAQKSVRVNKLAVQSLPKVESVLYGAVEALADGNGVLLRWDTKSETRNVGFYAYRLSDKGKELVNPIMVLGSYAKAGPQTLYGEKYQLFDPQGTTATSYVIESVGLDGVRISSDILKPRLTSRLTQSAGVTQESVENAVSSQTPSIEKETPAIAASAPLPADLAMHRWVVAQPGAKISVKKDGFYRVTRAELEAAGFAVGSDSANWRLFMEGNEQAIIVGPSGQYIEFLGRGIDTPESDTRIYYLISGEVAGKRVGTKVLRNIAGNVLSSNYPVTVEKKERTSYVNSIFNGEAENYWGRVVTSATTSVPFNVTGVDFGSPSISITIKMQGFSQTAHTVNALVNGHSIPSFPGSFQQPFSTTVSVPTSFLVEGNNTLQLSSGGQGDFSMFDTVGVSYSRKYQADQNKISFVTPGYKRVNLDGFASPVASTVTVTDTPPSAGNVEPAQSVPASTTPGVLRLGSPNFAGGEGGSAKITVARVFGNTGSVTADLTLTDGTAVGGPACAPGVDFVNPGVQTLTFAAGVTSQFVNVSLCADGVAESGETFTATLSNPTGGALLAQTDPRVFDTSEDGNPVVATNSQVTQNGSLYSMSIPANRRSDYYAIDSSYALQSPSVTQNTPSSLATAANAANFVIISYSAPDFMAAAESWASYRRSAAGGGFTVKVVDIADIFDEFSYGVRSSQSINDFLNYSYHNWQPAPQYVLMLGDGSYDPRNYEGFGSWDLVPAKIVTTVYTETASDEALADFDGDGLAELSVGRIPARTAQAITTALNKTTAFETPSMQSFDRGALFAYDLPQGWDFGAMSHTLRDQLPAAMPAVFVDRAATDAQTTLINEMNTGKYIVNYSGHGSTGLWAASTFFSVDNVVSLTNSSNQSLFTMLTCLNGYFLRPDADSLSETLLKANNGGAVATWASSGLTTPDIQTVMGTRFYNQLAAGNITRMGDLIRDAKSVLPASADVRFSWVLLGDPLLKVRP